MGVDTGLVEDELVKVGTSSANSPTKEIMDATIRAADDKTLALIFISNSYMPRYGEMLREFENEYLSSKGVSNLHPSTIVGAFEFMND